MSALVRGLLAARRLLEECGWVGPDVEPMCLATYEQLDPETWKLVTKSRACFEWDEGVRRFSVQGALIESRAWPEGWRLLEAVVAPAHAALDAFEPTGAADFVRFQKLCRKAVAEPTLDEWLRTAGRTQKRVLEHLVEAIKRAKKAAATGERHG